MNEPFETTGSLPLTEGEAYELLLAPALEERRHGDGAELRSQALINLLQGAEFRDSHSPRETPATPNEPIPYSFD